MNKEQTQYEKMRRTNAKRKASTAWRRATEAAVFSLRCPGRVMTLRPKKRPVWLQRYAIHRRNIGPEPAKNATTAMIQI